MDSPSIPINSGRLMSVVYAYTDTWAFFFLTLGLMFPVFFFFESPPAKPNTTFSPFQIMILITLGYYTIACISLSIRLIRSYTIARTGRFVLGEVANTEAFGMAGDSSIRLNVRYTVNNKTYIAKASVLGRVPEQGEDALVAIDSKYPSRYRVVPYDFRLFRKTREQIIKEIRR